jgi:AcrR family transcriptional regulator
MTQRTTFTKEMIVEAAYQLTRERGWHEVRARTIAQKLGSSTMPLYSTLKSMEEIEREVRMKAEACMQEYQRRTRTGETLLDAAVGYIVFARDERNLFRFLYVDRPVAPRQPAEGAPTTDAQDTGGVVDLAEQSAVAMKDPLVLKSWAFTHGLASLVSSGVLVLPDETIIRLLSEVGAAIYTFGTDGKGGRA